MTLTWKIFLGTALVVAAVLGGTLFVTDSRANETADKTVEAALSSTAKQVKDLLASRQEKLARSAEVFVQPAPFRAVVQKSDPQNLNDQAAEAVQQINADWVQITNGEGIRLAKSNEPAAQAVDLSGSALIGGALGGQSTYGVGSTGDTALYQAVAVPVQGTAEGTVIGVLMVTKAIDSTVAWEVKRASAVGGDSTDLVIYALDANNKPRVVTSTLTQRADIDAFLRSHITEIVPPVKGSGPGGTLTPAESARAEGMARQPARTEATIGGRRFVGQGGTLTSASGTPLGGFVALRSREAALAPFMALRKTILLGGAIGLVLSFLLSYVIAHQITRPIGALVTATRKAADGDYGLDIPVRSRDEIGSLATAFRALLADLRDKQALVELMSSGGGNGTMHDGKTMPIAISPTMQLAAGMTPVEPGQIFANRYQIVDVLGVGGMGMVYKATDRELGETVAIKTLKNDVLQSDPSALERFKSEIRLARKISHRNVVRTHDIGDASGVYFITMEFVEGKSLKDLIRARGRLPVQATLTIGKQLARALEVAHEQGIIHRDIKPQNMVVEPDGVLKVMDFGIARFAQRKQDEGHTRAGMVVGTPEYMAPEQLLGDDVDARVDIWAAGVVLYECLTGSLPFTADSPITLITKLLETTPRAPFEVASGIPAPLSDLVMRTLSKDREQRPKDAAELHDLLAAMD